MQRDGANNLCSAAKLAQFEASGRLDLLLPHLTQVSISPRGKGWGEGDVSRLRTLGASLGSI